ncbi:MAG: hypothetical protein R3F35_15620 [Myxococcota bacterium]
MIEDPDQAASALAAWLAERYPERTPVRVGPLARSPGEASNVTLLSEVE